MTRKHIIDLFRAENLAGRALARLAAEGALSERLVDAYVDNLRLIRRASMLPSNAAAILAEIEAAFGPGDRVELLSALTDWDEVELQTLSSAIVRLSAELKNVVDVRMVSRERLPPIPD